MHQSLCSADRLWQMHIVLSLVDMTELCVGEEENKTTHTHSEVGSVRLTETLVWFSSFSFSSLVFTGTQTQRSDDSDGEKHLPPPTLHLSNTGIRWLCLTTSESVEPTFSWWQVVCFWVYPAKMNQKLSTCSTVTVFADTFGRFIPSIQLRVYTLMQELVWNPLIILCVLEQLFLYLMQTVPHEPLSDPCLGMVQYSHQSNKVDCGIQAQVPDGKGLYTLETWKCETLQLGHRK